MQTMQIRPEVFGARLSHPGRCDRSVETEAVNEKEIGNEQKES
jgi:hypothetical protein